MACFLLMCGGLIVVRAGVGMWVEAYDNLDFFGSFCVKTKRTTKNNGKDLRPFRRAKMDNGAFV
jgi:hypothetical protein